MPAICCEALLFDLDGVLIDSDLIYERHWQAWAAQREVSFEHILSVHHGRPAIETMRIVAPHLDAVHEAERFNAVLAADRSMEGVRAFEGVAALLPRLPSGRWAIATSAPRRVAVPRLHHLGLPVPPVLVTTDDVARGKPAPDPYLQAAQGLGRAPARCLVIEDAPAGIAAARAAGAPVIALATTNAPEALQAADAVLPRLVDLEITCQDDHLHVRWTDGPSSST